MRNGGSPDDPAEDRGNAILSTLPLSEPVAVELPGERQRRVVIIAKAATISIAVVHLDALGGARRLRLFWTPWMRDWQVRYAAAVLPDGPLVIGGDLNTWHGRDDSPRAFSTSSWRRRSPSTVWALDFASSITCFPWPGQTRTLSPGRACRIRPSSARRMGGMTANWKIGRLKIAECC
jgi:endonuclease/exonuclease/phosphatase family metal-dependent hydrolase